MTAWAVSWPVSAAPINSSDVSQPQCDLADPTCGPIPGESNIYSDYTGKAAPFPATQQAPIKPTRKGSPGPDDLLFQNLLSAEWAIYSFYQFGVESFNASSFTALGLPNNTYQRISEIRDNEAGHLRIFQDSISPTSLKPGACKYDFGPADAESFIALQVLIEISSQAFLTGLVMQARTNATKGALVAIAEVETRHNTWALMSNFDADPFVGPSDTVFPYANQILDATNQFIVPGSCPAENPGYPTPNQDLPRLSLAPNTTSAGPGDKIQLTFSKQPAYKPDCQYHAVFFHGVQNITAPLDVGTNTTTIPKQFDGKGIILGVIADAPGAPTLESVVAGPLFLLEQPAGLATAFSSA